jgi:5'-methylthioadenosine phosphorylase
MIFPDGGRMDNTPLIAIIGGSGLYDMNGIIEKKSVFLDTPYGKPSSPITIGLLNGKRIAFIARHGIGHILNPSEVNYRANIYALKVLGVKKIISISACGSLREDYSPGEIVIPDQLFDFTKGRKRTFFENGCVAHISCANPFCQSLRSMTIDSLKSNDTIVHNNGTLITIEGPRFSTRAESNLFRAWGMSIIGMTASPEAFLAREAEMCYVTFAHVTDYDVWHISEEPVNVEMVVRTLNNNTQVAQESIRGIVADPRLEEDCECYSALKDAVITRPEAISSPAKEQLDPFLSKYNQ